MTAETYICGFCGKDIAPHEAALVLAISSARTSDGATQGISAHGQCLADRLHPSVPFVAEAFDD
jgi:hypothetical protein